VKASPDRRHPLWRAAYLALATTALAPALGCNLVVGSGDYRVGDRWGCVGSVASPAGTPGATVEVTFAAVQFFDGSPVQGVLVAACELDDEACPTPAVTQTTDEQGHATLAVRSGFAGYFDATAAGEMESLVYFGNPIVSAGTYALQVGKYADYEGLVTSVGGTVEPTDGAILVNTQDCLGQPAEGVQLSLAGPWAAGTGAQGVDPFYFLNGAPFDAATQPQTSTEGLAGFADVLPLRGELTATLAANGEVYARFASGQVRPKSLTVVWLPPTPL
jgi:hypothetical protein